MRRKFLTLASVMLLFASLSLAVSCGEKNGGATPEEPEVPEIPEEPEEPEELQTLLKADGDSAKTYALMKAAGYGIETPDLYGVHTEVQHITQRYDNALEKYIFDFHIHINEDDDRGIVTTTDRQRNEIKTDGGSPEHLLAFDGDKVKYHWYLLIPKGFLTTTSFSHIHQIKGTDNSAGTADVGMPIITHTVRTKSSKQQFEVRYTSPKEEGGKTSYYAETPLSEFLGEWVEITETIEYTKSGSYSLLIKRVSDGAQLVNFTETGLNMLRTGAPAIRPKWGIYRNFGDHGSKKDQLRDETIGFADFSIVKQ